MHRTNDQGANWDGAKKKKVQGTDRDLQEAEDWRPPRSPEGQGKRRKRDGEA
jgi:hypothetical protein